MHESIFCCFMGEIFLQSNLDYMNILGIFPPIYIVPSENWVCCIRKLEKC